MSIGQRIQAFILGILYWAGFDAYVESVIASAPQFDPDEEVDSLTPEQQARIEAAIQRAAQG